MTIGRIYEILEPQSGTAPVILVVEKFDIGSKHRRLKMPTINRPQEPVHVLAHIQVEFTALKSLSYSVLTLFISTSRQYSIYNMIASEANVTRLVSGSLDDKEKKQRVPSALSDIQTTLTSLLICTICIDHTYSAGFSIQNRIRCQQPRTARDYMRHWLRS